MFPTTANTYGGREFENFRRQPKGILYWGNMGRSEDGSQDDTPCMYFYNMHWEPHVFGLPHLPKGQTWHVLYDTSKGPEKAGVYGEDLGAGAGATSPRSPGCRGASRSYADSQETEFRRRKAAGSCPRQADTWRQRHLPIRPHSVRKGVCRSVSGLA